MVGQIIENRYKISGTLLYNCLKEMFGAEQVQVKAADNGDNWEIQVPRELSALEIIAIRNKCRSKKAKKRA